eukprot:TRINITY_DN12363_c0_g1_i1.p1 TRINITY_DN12363_c0_g1~~TRINITY_DN12363_c0_g1_i1.p1  ORF type:complete len:505 (+),score=205.90 TRINITY_DN12363_c0_g1_i1:144-1517(+)
MPDGEKQILQRLIQGAASENELKVQVNDEGIDKVASMCISCIMSTHQLDNVSALLELLVMLLRSVQGMGAAITSMATDKADPGYNLEKWCNDDTGRVVGRALEAFALMVSTSNKEYCDKWLKSLLKSIHTKLKDAKNAATEEACAEKMKTTEAAVKALSILSGPVHMRPLVIKPTAGDLSAPALLPYLLFPGEIPFATAADDHPQFIYDATKTLWHLSFTADVLSEIDNECRPGESEKKPIITVLNNLLVKQKKEKCVRMTLNCLMNYVKVQQEEKAKGNEGMGPNYIKDMIGVGMIQHLEMLQKRTFGDVDILPDVKELLELLETNVDDLSSYAMYKQEVHSGVLEWSPPHTSEKFWKETVKQFENDTYAPIKELAKMIATSKNPLNVQIACHDLGEFVRHHVHGKRIWEGLGIKARVYELIENGMGTPQEQEIVKKHALLCMQKIMVKRWEYLDH